MSLHIGAAPGVIADKVVITGDPLRARYIAESMLSDVVCYTEIRGMLGFTGYYQGQRVSVQGTGIGIPSTALYVHELIHDYGVQTIIRIGTCGALHPGLLIGQPIIATAAYSDSATHLLYYPDFDTPSLPSDSLLQTTRTIAVSSGIPMLEGPVFSTDMFYHPDPLRWAHWQNKGILAVEMESGIIYALAAVNNVRALTLLTVSDNILTHSSSSASERQLVDEGMMKLVFAVATQEI
jgi:purine-nucleoside phosphorylase